MYIKVTEKDVKMDKKWALRGITKEGHLSDISVIFTHYPYEVDIALFLYSYPFLESCIIEKRYSLKNKEELFAVTQQKAKPDQSINRVYEKDYKDTEKKMHYSSFL